MMGKVSVNCISIIGQMSPYCVLSRAVGCKNSFVASNKSIWSSIPSTLPCYTLQCGCAFHPTRQARGRSSH
jgi:hypothetical protein